MANKILEAYMSGVSQKRQTEKEASDAEFRKQQQDEALREFNLQHDELLRQHELENSRQATIDKFNQATSELKQQQEIQAHYASTGLTPSGTQVTTPSFSSPRTEDMNNGLGTGAVNQSIPTDLSGIPSGQVQLNGPQGTFNALTPVANAQQQANLLDITQKPLLERQAAKEQQILEGQSRLEDKKAALAKELETLKIASERSKEDNAHASKMSEISLQESLRTAGRIAAANKAGLNEKDRAAALRVSNQFDTSDITKRHSIIQEGVNFVKSIPDNSTNPGDDLGLIDAFAKIMNPGSIVRQQSADWIQKNATDIADRFKFDVKRINSTTQFLTPEARKALKETLLKRANSSQEEYNNFRKETSKKLQTIGVDPEKFLVDYGSVNDAGPKVGDKKTFPNGKKVIYDGTGWTDDQ